MSYTGITCDKRKTGRSTLYQKGVDGVEVVVVTRRLQEGNYKARQRKIQKTRLGVNMT